MALSEQEIRKRLSELKGEHTDLDEIIDVLVENKDIDQLKIKRLKKQKLRIKDMIATYENMLIPDLGA